MSPDLDLTPIVQPVLAVTALVFTGMLKVYIPKALDAFQTWTGVQLTTLQRQQVLGAVQTAAGMIETQLDTGVLTAAHMHIDDPSVRFEAQAVLAAVPKAALALDLTVDNVARMIVGKVDTSAHGAAAPLH
jgi:hypothetical protein